jgi:N-acylglucosamine-6-phosphate 2-epimerase
VSCQALEDEPLHSDFIMSKMALAAMQGGASGIRANSVKDVTAIRKTVDLPVIAIIKRDYEGFPVYITPTFKEVSELAETGVEVIAMDGTNDTRPGGETLAEIIGKTREQFPDVQLMADISTLEEATQAEALGFDYIGTTLHGYTERTRGMDISSNDFEYLKKILAAIKKPVIAEGKIDTPEKAARVLALGCHTVVVGGAITRPRDITRRFIAAIRGA